MHLSVNDVRLKHTKELLLQTADTFFDHKEHIPEGAYVSVMNAINELEKRFKHTEDERRAMFYVSHHPVSVNDLDVEMGEEVNSETTVTVVNDRNMTEDQTRERMVMDLVSMQRWRMWFEQALKKVKPLKRFTAQFRSRAYDLICSQEGIERSAITTYDSLRRRCARLADVDEKTFKSNFKTAYNMRIENKRRHIERFVNVFKMKEETLKVILSM